MSIYNRKGLAHSRKVITSSMGSTKPRYSIEAAFQTSIKETRRRLSENVGGSSMFNIREISSSHYYQRDYPYLNDRYFNSGNYQDVLEVRKIPTIFVSISKPSDAVDRLIRKRKTEHGEAARNMKNELAGCYEACESEFRNRSISVKIQINEFRKEIEETIEKLRKLNPLDSNSNDCEIAWKKVSELIENEKNIIHHFYNSLIFIEKKRQEYAKSILQKYYKIYHKISFLLPYEIQVYMENEILNYNEAVLENHRIYADLNLQMCLLADAANIKFKNLIDGVKIHRLELMNINNNYL